MTWKGWDGYVPPTEQPKQTVSDPQPEKPRKPFEGYNPPGRTRHSGPKLDRGRGQRGAQWQYVTPDGALIDYKQQHELFAVDWDQRKKTIARMGWILIQSKKEARRYIGLLSLERSGKIRNLRRQVNFPLMVRRPDGLMETLGHYKADHCYDELQDDGTWDSIVEDVKGNPEDLYLWKRKHFEAQNGKRIREI